MSTAVLVDGGFYLKRATSLWGRRGPDERADELTDYVRAHVNHEDAFDVHRSRRLYRTFFYDCHPYAGIEVWRPWDGGITKLGERHATYQWREAFHRELGARRKVAMRFGTLIPNHVHYALKDWALKDLLKGRLAIEDLGQQHFFMSGLKQAGVDMRIGLDAASLSHDGIVDQIILIAGDTDFVPVAKVARRAGIDVLLDPMGHHIREELLQNVDGIEDLSGQDPLR